MSSRNSLKHTVSTTAPPTNGALGDEWYNPATNLLYKLVANSGVTVSWYAVGYGVTAGGSSTSTITEGTNLYFTTARVLSALSSANIPGNVYYTDNVTATGYNTAGSGPGLITASSNINVITGGGFNVTGNITATGNVVANNFISTQSGAGAIASTSDITLSAAGNIYLTSNTFINSTKYLQGTVAVATLPVVNTGAAAYSLSNTDAGKLLLHTLDATARTWTIPSGLATGSFFTLVNDNSAGTITITATSDTLALANTALTGNRTLAANGIAQLYKITPTKWFVTGNGIS